MNRFALFRRFLLALLLQGLVSLGPPPIRIVDLAAQQTPGQSGDDQIGGYLDQLSSPHYSIRQAAFEHLRARGIQAFDALYPLRQSPPIERRLAVQRLLGYMQIDWTGWPLSQSVRDLLDDYSQQSVWRRKVLVECLTRADDPAAGLALAMLTRYEKSPALSRYAAVCLSKSILDGQPDPAVSASQLAAIIGNSQRVGCRWLNAAITSAAQPESFLTSWQGLIHELLESQQANHPNGYLSSQVNRELLRWYVRQLVNRQQYRTANEIAQRMVDSVADVGSLAETMDWLIQLELWAPLARLETRFQNEIQQDALFLYRLAQAEHEQGNAQAAEILAQQAGDALGQQTVSHLEMAIQLRQLGYHSFAKRELQDVIQRAETGSSHQVRGRLLLAEWLYEQGQFLAAANQLQPLVEQLSAGGITPATLQKLLGLPAAKIQARRQFFLACHARQSGDAELEIKHLIDGLCIDSKNLDLLISAYRCHAMNPELKQLCDAMRDNAAKRLQNKINSLKQDPDHPQSNQQKQRDRILAETCNRYAWLIANTTGNQPLASEYAQRAVQLQPRNGHYLDTLASCYLATGDLAMAVKIQTRACRLLPGCIAAQNRLASLVDYRQKSSVAADQAEPKPPVGWVFLR